MGHNINIDQFGRASFASARVPAWHALGQITEGAMTSKEALEEAGLNFTVAKADAYAAIPREASEIGTIEEYKEVPNTFITYRTDTNETFGPVGRKYTIIQNVDAFSFFDSIVGEGEAIYETAGALGKGETVFITAKLPGHIRVPGEEIDKYLLLRTTHDGKESIVGGFTPVRVVCHNTLQFALHSGLGHQIKIRHTASAKDKLNEAAALMGIANQLTEELGEVWTMMKEAPIVDKQVQELFKKLILTKDEIEERSPISSQKVNTLDDMWKYYFMGIGQKNIVGTKFGAYNAVSGYFQNVKSSSNPEGLLKSNMFGHNANVVKRSMDLLLVN
jgi:phage/plasmid-like protein (TIGR03299 family)